MAITALVAGRARIVNIKFLLFGRSRRPFDLGFLATLVGFAIYRVEDQSSRGRFHKSRLGQLDSYRFTHSSCGRIFEPLLR